MTNISTVAIVDDDPGEAEIISFAVKDAGFEPFIVEKGNYADPAQLAEMISSNAHAAVCDHRLQDMAFASFDGASLVAELVNRELPAILVTQFINMDSDVSIRRWRHRIPVLLKRGDADSEAIKQGLFLCLEEIKGAILPGRFARRTLVRIVTISEEGGEDVVDAIVPAWNPHEAIRFPASLLAQDQLELLDKDVRLFARVNIGAERSEDLFFFDFEVAAQPDEDDGLG